MQTDPFTLPEYFPPDFDLPIFKGAPLVRFSPVTQQGVAPDQYHATSIYPEYFQVKKGVWQLLTSSRMDCVVILEEDSTLSVKEFRHLQPGEQVACGRGENAEDGIYVHAAAFGFPVLSTEKFAFRTYITRETSFSIDYDVLYRLLNFEKDNGFILWVLGPAVTFDKDAREAFVEIINNGYVHGLLAGNALAVHDLEAALFKTALGQEIYSKKHTRQGHYKHLDTINRVRSLGSLKKTIEEGSISDGIMKAVLEKNIPYVLAGSIRDDGPLPEVIADAYDAQDQMRLLAKQATTVIAMATQLHAIATGNMLPAYHISRENTVRPVYLYMVDMSEFATSKLGSRGSQTAHSILTNVQDFIVTLSRGLAERCH